MKARHIVLGTGVAVVVIVATAAFLLLTSLDAIVERAIERYGSEITGTPVRVASVDISLASGRGTVRGLTVANPKGFSSDSAFSLDEITLQIDVGTVTSRPIVIDEINVGAPAALFEVNRSGAVNVEVIRSNADGGEPAAEEEEPLRLVIRKFSLRDGEISADTTAVGGKQAEVRLPPLTLSNIGAPQGATPGEVGKILVRVLAKQVAAAVAAQKLDAYLEKKIDEKLEGVAGKAAKELLRSLGE